jgi:hypothetical protein
MAQTTKQFTSEKMFQTIAHYDAYYGIKRTQRQTYVMNKAIERLVNSNDLENPNRYILYLIADKAIKVLTSKSEQGRISELEDELLKDLDLLQRMESFNI